jgi:hemerythrin
VPYAEWDPSLETGDEQVDAEHRDIYSLVAQMQQAVESGGDDELVDASLTHILSYVQTHFAHEEQLMEAAGYQDLPHHRQLHEAFAEQVKMLAAERLHGEIVSAAGLTEFMHVWLVEHIDREDRRLVECLRNEQDLA